MKLWKLFSPVLLLGAVGAANATVIDTTPQWDGEHALYPFGSPNTATVGQTFMAGANTALDSFTFYLDDFDNALPVSFQVYLAAWDGTKAVGGSEQLLGSGATTGQDGFEAFTMNFADTLLGGAGQYVVFVTTSLTMDSAAEAFLGSLEQDHFTDGDLMLMNNGNDFSQLFNQDWNYWFDADMAFQLVLTETETPVPEPWSLSVLGLGLLGLARLRRQRR